MTVPDKNSVESVLQKLYPICRSLTGEGVVQSLEILTEITELTFHTVPSGTAVYDWEVPPEWNINDAYIKNSDGNRVVDFNDHNLHVVNYSTPVQSKLHFSELKDHLHTLPNMPDAIPYRTTYYERDWGFCLRHSTVEGMDEDETYEVCIDSSLDSDGVLTYADAKIEGRSDKEYIISTYCCHPSLANDNLSGLVAATVLFEQLKQKETYHSYRLIIVPETIGSISYLSENEAEMKDVDGGYVLTTVAGGGSFDYKCSFVGDHPVDKAARWALQNDDYTEHDFAPSGSDERQYSSPGFRVPTGTIAKDKYYEYDEYHTSKDNLDFISPEDLLESVKRYLKAIDLLEKNRTYKRVDPHCEFKLDRHNLSPTIGGQKKQPTHLDDESHEAFSYELEVDESISGDVYDAIQWLMFGCDSKTSLFQLAEKSGMSVDILYQAAQKLRTAELLEEAE